MTGVLSPASATLKRAKVPLLPLSARAPIIPPELSVGLPLRFVVMGMLSLLTAVVGLVCRPDVLATYHYNQYVIAITHLFTLGWITSVVMGAMYQLVPVALETRLYSEKLAKWQFVLHAIGMVGMVSMFWVWNVKHAGHFGCVMAAGMGLFIYNIARTLKTIPRWNVIAFGIVSALFWLTMTMLAGLYVVASKCWSFSPFATVAQMHAHAHVGGVGFFVMMIIGVSYKLIPMFALTNMQSERRAWWSIALLNSGLAGLFVTLLIASPWKLAFALVVILGLGLYGLEMTAMLRARMRRILDWGLKYFLTAVSLLAPLSILAMVLCWPGLPLTIFTGQLENVYGFVAFAGVVTLAILGMLYKTVPFLVWYHSYSREIGRSRVPALADLYSAPLQIATYWLFLAGLAAVCAAAALGNEPAVRWSVVLLMAGILTFVLNIGKIMIHFVRPKIEALVLPTKLKGNA
jgi:hypothetical protein